MASWAKSGWSAASSRDLFLWLLIGLLAAATAQIWLDTRIGGPAAGLTVGQHSGLRESIESEVGSVALWPSAGHDAQLYYQAASDPLGAHSEAAYSGRSDSQGYRYRRVLLPFLASGGYQLTGANLATGMAIVTALGGAMCLAAATDLTRTLGGRDTTTAIVVLFAPGWLVSSMIFTPDALGLGLATAGLALHRRGRVALASAAVGLAVAAKEQFLLVGAVLVLHALLTRTYRKAASLAVGPALAVGISVTYAQMVSGSGLTLNGQLSSPGRGIASSVLLWPTLDNANLAIGVLVLALMVAAIALPLYKRNLETLMHGVAWVTLGLLLDSAVWEVATNAARALTMLSVVVAISVSVPRRDAWSDDVRTSVSVSKSTRWKPVRLAPDGALSVDRS